MLPGKGDSGNTDNSKLDSGIKKNVLCLWDGLRDLNLLFAAVEEAAEEEAYSTLMNKGG